MKNENPSSLFAAERKLRIDEEGKWRVFFENLK
jgi:hypothetical protein